MTVSSRSDVALLANDLSRAARVLEVHGELLWDRSHEWVRLPNTTTRGERGGGLGDGVPDDVVEERMADAQASRYAKEVVALLRRMDADAARLVRLVEIVVPQQPRLLGSKEMLAAQVAAEGWCVSCWRNDQKLEPVQTRITRNGELAPFYRDLCRFCGGWKKENGQIPPLDVIERHHDGRRIVAKA